LTDSKELRRLEAQLRAKTLEVQSGRAARYPQFELVAQYGLFAKFQNYEEFFRRFERHNGQIAVSIALPVLPGSGSSAEAARAELEMTRLRTELNSARERITVETRRSYQDVQNAETGREVARLDLEFARDQLGVLLSQYQEGRTGLRQIEEARNLETAKWMAFYDAQSAFDRARLNLLRQTGDIMAALK
jgi:outer membrane protein TolC